MHGDALYFSKPAASRSTATGAAASLLKHIGLYAYRRAVLETFHSLPPSSLERAEQLEQLRLLEAGIRIPVLETDRAHHRRRHRGGPPGRRGPARRPRPVTNRWAVLALIMAAQTMANVGPLGIPSIAPLIRETSGSR